MDSNSRCSNFRILLIAAGALAFLSLLLPSTTSAEIFTVTLDNGNTIDSRYQPKVSMPDESKVMLLTESGNWISFPRESVVGITTDTESRGFGRVINTTTIALGFAPNEGDPAAEAEAAMDPTTQLLRYLTQRDSKPGRDYSVQQFVDVEQAGQGGFPSSYGTSAGSNFSNRARSGTGIVPGNVPVAPTGDGGSQ